MRRFSCCQHSSTGLRSGDPRGKYVTPIPVSLMNSLTCCDSKYGALSTKTWMFSPNSSCNARRNRIVTALVKRSTTSVAKNSRSPTTAPSYFTPSERRQNGRLTRSPPGNHDRYRAQPIVFRVRSIATVVYSAKSELLHFFGGFPEFGPFVFVGCRRLWTRRLPGKPGVFQ